MEIMDVTLRESVYYGSGIDYVGGIDYLKHLVNYINPEDMRFVEVGYLNTDEEGHLNYKEDYLLSAYDILHHCGFKTVAMMHPGRADISKWNKDVIEKLNLVRIVCNGKIVPESVKEYIDYLHSLNVRVSVNIAYVLSKDDATITKMYTDAQTYGADYIYFADSSGSAITEDVDRLCDLLKKLKANNAIGFHLHDHLNMAFANGIRVFKNGIDITDVSITGAGKGGGNLKMEFMLPFMRKLNNKNIDGDMLKNMIGFIRFFNILIKRKVDYHEQAFLDTYVGLFKIPLKKQEELEFLAAGDSFKYTDLVLDFAGGG